MCLYDGLVRGQVIAFNFTGEGTVIWSLPAVALSGATGIALGPHPFQQASPSPSPVSVTQTSSSTNTVAIVAGTVAGGLFLVVALLVGALLWCMLARRRRKYYEGDDGDAENNVGFEMQKFTFR